MAITTSPFRSEPREKLCRCRISLGRQIRLQGGSHGTKRRQDRHQNSASKTWQLQPLLSDRNLAKSSVAAVFLSDDKSDYKAVVTEQSDAKIVIKIPQVKHGNYNLSFQIGTSRKALSLPYFSRTTNPITRR